MLLSELLNRPRDTGGQGDVAGCREDCGGEDGRHGGELHFADVVWGSGDTRSPDCHSSHLGGTVADEGEPNCRVDGRPFCTWQVESPHGFWAGVDQPGTWSHREQRRTLPMSHLTADMRSIVGYSVDLQGYSTETLQKSTNVVLATGI